MTDELKPCPFCGGEASDRFSRDLVAFVCNFCGAEGPYKYLKAEAIAAWNRRADISEHDDGEQPVTEEWLRSIGFTEDPNDTDVLRLIVRGLGKFLSPITLDYCDFTDINEGEKLQVRMGWAPLETFTRNQVRSLLKALGE